MREHGRGDFHDDAVEHLLRDVAACRRAGDDPLADLLHAAAAPGRPEELAGRAAAMAAFRAARPGASATPAGAPPRRFALGRLLTVKIAALAAAVAVGGVALAASVGVLPNPLRPAPASSSSSPLSPGASHSTTSQPTSAGPSATSAPTAGPSAAPVPTTGLAGLCHAYLRDPDRGNGKAKENPAYSALADAAGGRELIEGYCTGLIPEKTKAPAKPSPSHPQPSRNTPAR
jgi:hypothetical protein